jgi:hypothetical protein
MSKISRYLSVVVLGLGVAAIAIGIAFIVQGISKDLYLRDALRDEKITLGLSQEQIENGDVVDNSVEAQRASDIVRNDRRKIAPTYSDLLGGKQFDPTNPTQITYMQALNLEDSLNLAVASFGLALVVIVTGVFMLLAGIALIIVGWVTRGLAKRTS